MQVAEVNIGIEQSLDVPIREKGIQEMQNVLSRCLPSFYRKPIDTWAIPPTRRMRFKMHFSRRTDTWTNSGRRRKCRRG
jgi:hypothetical protein